MNKKIPYIILLKSLTNNKTVGYMDNVTKNTRKTSNICGKA